MTKVTPGPPHLAARTAYETPLRSQPQPQALRSSLAGRAEAQQPEGPRSPLLQKIGGLLRSIARSFRPAVPQGPRLEKAVFLTASERIVQRIVQTISECAAGNRTPANIAREFDYWPSTAHRLNEEEMKVALRDALNQRGVADLLWMKDFLGSTSAVRAGALTKHPATGRLLNQLTNAVDAALVRKIEDEAASNAVRQVGTAVQRGAHGAPVAQLLREAFEGGAASRARLGLQSDALRQSEYVSLKLASLEPPVLAAILRSARTEDLARLRQAPQAPASVKAAVDSAVTERAFALAAEIRDQARSFIPSYDDPAAFLHDLTQMGATLENLKTHCATHGQPDPFAPGQLRALAQQVGTLAALALRPDRIDPSTLSSQQLLGLSQALHSLGAYDACRDALDAAQQLQLNPPHEAVEGKLELPVQSPNGDGRPQAPLPRPTPPTREKSDYFLLRNRVEPYLVDVLDALSRRYRPDAPVAGSEDEQRFRDSVERLLDEARLDALEPTQFDYAEGAHALRELSTAADGLVAKLVGELGPQISALSQSPPGIPLHEQAGALRGKSSKWASANTDLGKELGKLYEEIARLPKSTANPFVASRIRTLTQKISEFSQAVSALAIIRQTQPVILKALRADQQIQLLTALRAGREPNKKLPEPLHGAQLKLYLATSLDPDFLAAESRVRTAVIGDLTRRGPTLEWLTRAWKEWPTLPLRERMPVLRRIVNLHCQRAGFLPPLSLNASVLPGRALACWLPESRAIRINAASSAFDDFEAMAESIFHENSHNYQDALMGRGGREDIDLIGGRAKLATQVKLFAANIDYYVDGSESPAVYVAQPVEAHAHLAGRRFARELCRILMRESERT